MLHGAIHRPDHPALLTATPYRVGAASALRNWLSLYPADGDILANDVLGCCCEVADFRWLQIMKALDGEHWPIPVELVKLRYQAIGGWNGIVPGNDPGSIPAADCFALQAAPILDDTGRAYPAKWHSVGIADMADALRRGPLLATIGLTAANEDDPKTWHVKPVGAFVDYHRVLVGFQDDEQFVCRSYGFDYYVHPAAFVGVDWMERITGLR